MIGKTISHYKIIEQLGAGGMGVVYKAEDTKLKRTVALKFLPPDLTRDLTAKKRFMHEARAASALEHPNICTIFEIDETEEGQAFIAMSYCEGETIKQKIEQGTLNTDQTIKFALQCATALQKAHQQGIIHRDIKPANAMVTSEGEVKILDFGLAKLVGQTRLTITQTTMGTVAYMSPEQARGEGVDHRTDIWSLGVMLYEMLSGELPFKGDYEQAVIYSIVNEDPQPLTALRADIPPEPIQIVTKMLEKNSDNRYQEMSEIVEDLQSLLDGTIPTKIVRKKFRFALPKVKPVFAVVLLITVFVVISTAFFLFYPIEGKPIKSIAVLPLVNLTGDAGQEYFVDGATDELIGQLARISTLRVISRQSVMRYKESDKSLPEIARELNVDAVVEGTVYQVGESVRIRVQLIDALPEEQNLWADTYDRDMTDVLVMYSEMARTIADKIHVNLTTEEMIRLASIRQVNPKAYEAYLKGRSYWYSLSSQNLETALQHFESALEIDPNYALAHTGVGLVWVGRYQMNLAPRNEAVPLSIAAAEKALELDSTLAEAHYALAAYQNLVRMGLGGC